MSFQSRADNPQIVLRQIQIVLRQIDEALQAVIELHQPIYDKDTDALLCEECTHLSPVSIKYPCQTIKVIQEKIL
jgi:hypothetical protein